MQHSGFPHSSKEEPEARSAHTVEVEHLPQRLSVGNPCTEGTERACALQQLLLLTAVFVLEHSHALPLQESVTGCQYRLTTVFLPEGDVW